MSNKVSLPQMMHGKANINMDNLSEAGKTAFFPSDTFVELTPENTKEYTAPANGYFTIRGSTIAAGDSLCELINTINGANSINRYQTAGKTQAALLPVKKGDTVQLAIQNFTPVYFRFIYASYEAPEELPSE